MQEQERERCFGRKEGSRKVRRFAILRDRDSQVAQLLPKIKAQEH